MRRLFIALLLAASPALAASRTSFRVGARVVDSAAMSAQVGHAGIVVKAASRSAALVQVGDAAPAPMSAEQNLALPSRGEVTVTLLY